MSLPIIDAVVVTFNPGPEFPRRLETYIRQVRRVRIIDNSTEPRDSFFAPLSATYGAALEVVRNGDNLGLAQAQNIGVSRAMEDGAEWVIFFDDDSEAAPDMVARLFAAYAAYAEPSRIALLAPVVRDRHSGDESRLLVPQGLLGIRRVRADAQAATDKALTVIASGSALKTEVIRQCGPFREAYFIDWVDIEYCLRLRAQGWRILVAGDAVLYHALGRKTKHGLPGATFATSNHMPWRRYTMYRNRIDSWQRYGRKFPAYVAYDATMAAYEALKILCLERQKAAKLSAMLQGLRDGMLGRFPRPPL